MKCLQMPPKSDFTRRLFAREYELTISELYALREDLIGSRALIAMVRSGWTPDALNNAIAAHTHQTWNMFSRVQYYIRDAAWGLAGAQHRGLLPKSPVLPVVPFVTALKDRPVKWSEFWDWVEREKSEGALKSKPAWAGAVRDKVQRRLDALSDKFSE